MYSKIFFAVITITIGVYVAYNYDFLSTLLNSYTKDHSYKSDKGNLFTSDEIKLYNGIDRKELYLVLLGKVFDVTKGESHYGPGQTYHTFIGRDNSRAFITGDFDLEKSSDEVIDLGLQELKSLKQWAEFYRKDYKYIGKLIGKFYNQNGKLTPYGREVKAHIKEAEQAEVNEDLQKLKFPPCNVEWDPEKGTRFWCTRLSGGIKRDWVGVPRQLYEVGSDSYRCACISEEHISLGNIKQYDGCAPNSESCFVKS